MILPLFLLINYLYLTMENSIASSERFSFGEVAETEYVSFKIVETHNKLPYNPFLFDLKLAIVKVKPGYQQANSHYLLSREKANVFGRRKKQPKDWTDQSSVPIYLNAETISQRHFRIDQNYMLKDENSKHGTYLWVDRQNPRKIRVNDTFLVAKNILTIKRAVHLPRPSIEMSYDGRTINVQEHQKLFLVGSHSRCDLVIPCLYHFEVCINVSTFTIFTHLEEQEASPDHGLWYRLKQKEEISLGHGNLIYVEPYVFRVAS